MTDKLESVLVDAIQKTQAGIGEAVDFAIAQSPEVIEQLLLWKAIESGIIFTLLLLVLLAYVIFVCKVDWRKPEDSQKETLVWEKHSWKNSQSPRLEFVLIFGMLSVMGIPLIINGILSNLDWLKIWIAPKLYLVEYAASLVK